MTNRLKVAPIIAAFALAMPAAAQPPSSEGWTLAYEYDEAAFYLRDHDWFAGRPTSASVKVWSWVDQFARPGVEHSLNLIEINCVAERYRFLKSSDYDAKGKATDGGTSQWDYVTPGTIISEVVRLTCMEPAPQSEQQPRLGDFW